MAHKLTSPLAQSETFLPLLSTIDTSMVYSLAHPNYKESPAYLTKFRAYCLTRALEMVRSHVKRCWRRPPLPASEHLELHSQSAHTFLWQGLELLLPRGHLIAEAERRASSLSEYTLVQDLQSTYLACRMELLQPSV